MHALDALTAFLPTDPGYAAFGWRRLRGLNTLHFALVGIVGLMWGGMEDLAEAFTDSEAPVAFWQVLTDVLREALMLVVMFTPTLALATIASNATGGKGRAARVALLAAATLLGALIHGLTWIPAHCALGLEDTSNSDCVAFGLTWNKVGSFTRAFLWGALITAVLHFDKRARDSDRALHEAHLQRLNGQRQETEARLRSLQAQIEPHFLFNTLAHIQRLHQVNPQLGGSMLRDLIDYLRSALPQMRAPESTLGRELALTRAYLNVQQIRMGGRLRVEVDVAPELLDARLPPMMLVTLAENAIKHGLSPKREGGTLHIGARLAQGGLEVAVVDDGAGLKMGAGSGRGLANIRARLATLFGAHGVLDIENNAGGGVRAALTLPFTLTVPKATTS
jgi:hypothetical protein